VFKRLKTISFKREDNALGNDEDDHFDLKDLEEWDVYDVTRYNKKELQLKVKQFLEDHPLEKLEKRLKAIRMSERFIESHKFPLQLEYTSEYLDALHKYQSTRRL